jgi:hypothetical protein
MKDFFKKYGEPTVFLDIGLTERRSTSSGHPTVAKADGRDYCHDCHQYKRVVA